MIEAWAVKKIHEAFENRDIGSVQSLVVQRCINPNALIPRKGVSLLHLIIGHQSESFAFRVSKLFLTCGGDPNVQSSDGVTPVHVAAAWGRNRILHLLLTNGGDPWMQDDEKKNAFNYAFEERKWNAVEMLHHFQQMHSAASRRQDVVDPSKHERSSERVFPKRGGEEAFARAASKERMKSMTTQTESEVSSPSPVQDRIKYFEPVSSAGVRETGREKESKGEMGEMGEGEEGGEIGWAKDFYQTPCEVVVHEDAVEKAGDERRFVSSFEMATCPVAVEHVVEKSDRSSADVRGQLFVELREAVRRRSKVRTDQMAEKTRETTTVLDEPVLVEDDPCRDSFVAKEVSYLYGIDLQESGILKNMSDFATKVMKEIEVAETDRTSEKTIDLCASSTDFTGTYLSCGEENTANRRKSDLRSFLAPRNDSDASNVYVTPYSSDIAPGPVEENSNESFASLVDGEHKSTDAEERELASPEKKLVVTPTISFPQEDVDGGESIGEEDESAVSSNASSAPLSLCYDSDLLRSELNGLGYNPGPVTQTTKKLYLRKLWKLKKEPQRPPCASPEEKSTLVRCRVLERTLTDEECFRKISIYARLEEEMCQSFENWTRRKWREGTHKTSFNYLLLDPRVSLDLPKRAGVTPTRETWKDFVSAIFYVGKGKRCRPYAHLYQAAAAWEKRTAVPPDGKTKKIIDIWKDGLGVVCLQVFQNVMPVEALTREAAMIEALGLSGVKNTRAGMYYGVASTWTTGDKTCLGMYLLYKAMLIFMNEGERQIKPYDVD